ncbi:MAG: protein kinase [Clostridiales bacterium]|nr:protein kinase [Clostridiales bacterium]
MNCYFEEGENFVWIRDREKGDSELAIALKMIREKYRNGDKQAMVAEDIRTEKKYFVKVLFCNNLEQIYVEKESKVQLYSPYVVRIFGGMLDEKNRRFITLVEYIDENDLSDMVRSPGVAGNTWNEKMRSCNTIALKILYGIDHYMSMHREDPIVHRDLKPENIVAAPDGSVVKIIDFDWVHLHDSNMTVMLRREQKGTPGYADPRYWNSYICRKEMDIYSAGLVLYYLYTGNHHFYGNEELQRYMVGDDYAYELKEMPGIDGRLTKIIARMIAREGERYTDIREVIADMEQYLTSVGRMPELPELLKENRYQNTIRFSYKVGDVKYSPYLKDYRFVPIVFGKKQERSRNGKMSGHIMSFYRTGDKIKAIILHEDCHTVRQKDPAYVSEGDLYSYVGTNIEILQIKKSG